MLLSPPTWRHSIKLALWSGIVALACVVFLWGIQYKVSLYNPHPANTPPAKLVTGRSSVQVQQAIETLVKSPVSTLPLASFLLLCALSLTLSLAGRPIFEFQRALLLPRRPQPARSRAFASRPPPFRS